MFIRLRSLRMLGGVCAFGLTLGAPLPGQTSPTAGVPDRGDTLRLTLSAARSTALRANPSLLAARLDTAVARGELRQASLFIRSNPTVDLGFEPGVSQEIEVFGQQATRTTAARAGLARAGANVTNATRLTIGDVDRAFFGLYSAVRRSRLADEVLGLTERIADVAQRQLAAGEIGRLEFNLATVELGRSRARAFAARREREQGVIEMLRLLGLPRDVTLEPVLDTTQHVPLEDSTAAAPEAVSLTQNRARAPGAAVPTLDTDSLTALALARRPDLAEREAARRQLEAEATAARREALPNLVVRGVTEPEDQGSGRVLRPGLGLTLPFFNRNRGRSDAFRAAARQAELERSARVATIRAEVAAAVASYQAAATAVQVLETTVLTPARQNRRLVEVAFREGKVGLPELLLIRNQAIDAELDYWTAWLAERNALTSIAEVTSANTDLTAAEQLR